MEKGSDAFLLYNRISFLNMKTGQVKNSPLLRFTVGYEVTTKASPLKHLCHKVNLHLFDMVVPSPRHTLESPGKDKTVPMPWSYP